MVLQALNTAALPVCETSPIVLMVSGGSDSTALLVRAATGQIDLQDGCGPRTLPLSNLVVLHVNHGIRGEASDGDEAFVCDLCAHLGVVCEVERIDVPNLLAQAQDAQGRNLELVAREERYRLAWELASRRAQKAQVSVRCARILVAHTADDRAETLVMRVMSGAGLSGLAGMRRARGIVVRPLLDATREELRAELRARGIGWREDATNDEDAALRSYVRHHVLPAMRERNPSLASTMGHVLDELADDADLLDRLAKNLLDRAMKPSRPPDAAYLAGEVPAPNEPRRVLLDAYTIAQAEPSLARRALIGAVQLALGERDALQVRLEARHVAWMLELARTGSGTLNLPLDTRVSCRKGLIEIEPASVRARESERAHLQAENEDDPYSGMVCLSVPGEIHERDYVLRADRIAIPLGAEAVAFAHEAEKATAQSLAQEYGVNADQLQLGRDYVLLDCEDDELLVGAPLPGERMEPFGLGGHHKLVHDVLADAHVPASVRSQVPVVRRKESGLTGAQELPSEHMGGANVVWVAGIRPDQRCAYSPKTRTLLRLQLVLLGNNEVGGWRGKQPGR